MSSSVKKKNKKARYKRTADEFEIFLAMHPLASKHRQVRTFDAIADAQYEREFADGILHVAKSIVTEVADGLEDTRSSSR